MSKHKSENQIQKEKGRFTYLEKEGRFRLRKYIKGELVTTSSTKTIVDAYNKMKKKVNKFHLLCEKQTKTIIDSRQNDENEKNCPVLLIVCDWSAILKTVKSNHFFV